MTATIIFYEKPGCINNTKQKQLLQSLDYTVQSHNLLTEVWTTERLRQFFQNLPISAWFNPSAPQIKSGEIVPEQLKAEIALDLMVKNPILIRRPLMCLGDRYLVGFDQPQVAAWLAAGLTTKDLENLGAEDLQTCPRPHSH